MSEGRPVIPTRRSSRTIARDLFSGHEPRDTTSNVNNTSEVNLNVNGNQDAESYSGDSINQLGSSPNISPTTSAQSNLKKSGRNTPVLGYKKARSLGSCEINRELNPKELAESPPSLSVEAPSGSVSPLTQSGNNINKQKTFRSASTNSKNDIDKAAEIIEDIGNTLPGFTELWKNSSESIRNEVLFVLVTNLSASQITKIQDRKPDRSHRHTSENPQRANFRKTTFNMKNEKGDVQARYSLALGIGGIPEQPLYDPNNLSSAYKSDKNKSNPSLSKLTITQREDGLIPEQSSSGQEFFLAKRREKGNTKGGKPFSLIDTKLVYKKDNRLHMCIKLYQDYCFDFIQTITKIVQDIEIMNMNLVEGQKPEQQDIEKIKKQIQTSGSSLLNTVITLLKEFDIEKRDQSIRAINKDLSHRQGEAGEVDAKIIKIGLYRNLIIKQLLRKLLGTANSITCSTSQTIANCLEMSNSVDLKQEKDISLIMHTVCLFSSLGKLVCQSFDYLETIIQLFKYEPAKVDAKVKADEIAKRKIKLKNIWNLNQEHSEENIYRASSIEELIVRGTSLQSVDMFYTETLITTSLFLGESPITFVEILLERFFPPANKFSKDVETQFRIKALKVLRAYLTTNYYHLDSQLQFVIFNFCEVKLPRAITNQDYVDSIKDRLNLKIQFELPAEEKKIHQMLAFGDIKPYDILQFMEQEVADQLTVVDLIIFKKIKHFELLGQAWSKPKLQHLAINVTELITRPNKISFWVATCILLQPKLKDRVKTVTHFIQIAQKLDELKNYNTMMGVLAGLNSSAISRLHLTNAQIEKRIKTIFEELNSKVNPEKAFKNLRGIMESCQRPCLPYIGIYLTDLTFIDEGNPDVTTVDGVEVPNFPKQQMNFSAINNLLQFQQNIVNLYNLTPKEPLHSFFTELPSLTENELWELSLEREPRAT